jgi:hypothetical protein
MFRATQWLILAVLTLVAITQAYLIDDSDATILQYVVNPSASVKWGPFGDITGETLSLSLPNGSMFTVDNTPCYKGT